MTSPVAMRVRTREGSSLRAERSRGAKTSASVRDGIGVGEGEGRGEGERVAEGDGPRTAFSGEAPSSVQEAIASAGNSVAAIAAQTLHRGARPIAGRRFASTDH